MPTTDNNHVVYKPGFVLFWDGFLSQWFPRSFVVDNQVYSSAEQWMMWSKAKLFGDTDRMAKILATDNCWKQKMVHGRKVANFDDAVWKANNQRIVYEGNIAKFYQNPDLLELLFLTGKDIIVEASPKDTIWGIGMDANDPRCLEPSKWLGTNLLGVALMRVRHYFQYHEDGMKLTFKDGAFLQAA